MKKESFIHLAAFISLILPINKDTSQFNGSWTAFDLKNYHFNINLSEKNGQLSGDYCAYPKDLSRMDCSTDNSEKCVIFGNRKLDSGYIHFVSCYSGDTGLAVITILNNNLVWKTLKNPYTGTSISWNGVPDKAKLKREKTK